MDVGHIRTPEGMDPEKRFEMQKLLWEKMEKIKSDYIFKYGAGQFYTKTGTNAKQWHQWEKEVKDYFAHGGFINLNEVADEATNKIDYVIGRMSKALTKAGINVGKLYLEGASRFPNEDAPHSEAGKQLEEMGKK
ncbi:MAG: hypothetical protein J7M03_02375 [Candidatus Desulfofervidaceae bacterium]|nr:hypothetical protein [Candidatus Desulfofervidaceae bacterium]